MGQIQNTLGKGSRGYWTTGQVIGQTIYVYDVSKVSLDLIELDQELILVEETTVLLPQQTVVLVKEDE